MPRKIKPPIDPPPPPPPPPVREGTVKVIDPVTRLEGHLKIAVTVENGVVTNAGATGTLFRGFENLLIGRHPSDSQHITQRICGVCPVSHGMAAVMALDAAYGVTAPTNARILRNLVMGANLIDSHILHFYHLTLPDFIDAPALNLPPWDTDWVHDENFSDAEADTLASHYLEALKFRRLAHEMGAIFGGKLPHPPTYIPGGFTTRPTSDAITRFENILNQIIGFINNYYIPDAQLLASRYPAYDAIGSGYGNLLAFGCFDQGSGNLLLKRGRIVNGSTRVQAVDVSKIAEYVKYSWYADNSGGLNPQAGVTSPVDPAAKPTAYSWLKAPRYEGVAYEAGPLARMVVSGLYPKGKVSVNDRHLARALETLEVAEAMQGWLNQLRSSLGQAVSVSTSVPTSARAFGLTEAPRGALGHWLEIANAKISRYQVITPTCWNASPRDANGVLGPIEQALLGTPVKDLNRPIEVLRVIHSFDPCLACAVHVMRPGEGKKVFRLPHFHGGEEVHAHRHDHEPGHRHPHGHSSQGHTHDHEP
jgi:hydrogenase large subunit